MLAVTIALIISFILGFFTAAILASGKISDLQEKIFHMKLERDYGTKK